MGIQLDGDFPLDTLDVALIRRRVAQPSFKPFIIFASEKQIRLVLADTDVDVDACVKKGRKLASTLFAFIIAIPYDGTEFRRAQGLVSISSLASTASPTEH